METVDGRMSQVVDDVIVLCHEIGAIRILGSEFHLEKTSVQIHVVLQSRKHEFHGSNARGGGVDGDHTVAIEGNLRLGHFEQTEAWIGLEFRSLVSNGCVLHGSKASFAFSFEITYHVITGRFGYLRQNPSTELTHPLPPSPQPPSWSS